ncbi:NAD(P)-dependent oxidoreductase [Sphingobium sp. CR28]|uniref:NAD(P)-dependent oxidoreductase n=1 Tax=Sphingobium sp. CR28 TaxID=3400272 RepID=UPI003FED9ADF
MHSLPIFVRIAGQPVILIGSGEAADAKRRLIERAGGIVVGEGDAAARLAFVAEDEPDAAAAWLKARGLLINVADRPDLCDFTLPAIVDRDPVIVAVGTGGASAGLAAALRQRIEAILPARLGDLARALHTARARMRAKWPDAGARRRALGEVLAPGGLLDPLGGIYEVDEWLESGHARSAAQLYTLGLRSSDPEDLTLRDVRMLGLADRIVHPAETPAAILDRARADAARIVSEMADEWWDMPGLTVFIDMAGI